MQIQTSAQGVGSHDHAEAPGRISEHLSSRIGAEKFDTWFSHTQLRVSGRRLEVRTDSQFIANWIDSHYTSELTDAARATLGADASIDVKVSPEAFGRRNGDARRPRHESRPRPDARPTRTRRAADPRTRHMHRLDEFVVGTSNRLAYSAAMRLAEDPDAHPISPLFIHGECGLGKTHLLQGICRRFAEVAGRDACIRYVTGEQFTNEYIAAVRDRRIEAFRRQTRKLDLLAIDDVHFLANKVRTQSEFLHTLDAIDLTGARVVLASDNHPRQIRRFSQALISRFLSGMVVQVEMPDHDTRVELIRRLSSARGISLKSTAAETIATRCLGSVRELEGAITMLAAMRSLTSNGDGDAEVGTVLVDTVFQQHAWEPAAPVRMNDVIDAVCARLAVTRADLMGAGRHQKLVLARALVAYLGRELTAHSYPEIAEAMGRSFHSSAHSAAKRLRRQLEDDRRMEVAGVERPLTVRELTERLRHEIMRGASRNGNR